jgi:hypothetical protein
MKANDHWQKLARAARLAPQPPATGAPYGFATRVVARWQADEAPATPSPWEWLSIRALAVAALLMVAALGTSFDLLGQDWTPEAPADDVLQIILEP